MTALVFPSSPTSGQQYTAAGSTWEWDGLTWFGVAAATPPVPTDPYFSSVKCLWHFDTMHSISSLINTPDASGNGNNLKPNTITGGVSSEQSKFGGKSWHVGSNSSARNVTTFSSSVNIGTGDFTIEGWFYRTSNPGQGILIEFSTNDSSQTVPFIKIGGTGTARVGYAQNPTIEATIFTTTAVTLNTWHHFAVSRNSGTSYLYFNGVAEGGSYSDSNNFAAMQQVILGTLWNTANYFVGYLDEFRVTVGVGRYPSGTTFTVPSAPFPDQ